MIRYYIPSDFVDLREIPLDLHDIEMNVRDFFICLNAKDDLKNNYLDARNYLDNARFLVRDIIIIQENEYVSNEKNAYLWMLDNLGRADKYLIEIEDNLMGNLDEKEILEGYSLPKSSNIRRYVNLLIRIFNLSVYFPLKNALLKYKNISEDLRNKKSFEYLLFLELFNSSESLGSITSQKTTLKKRDEIPYHRVEYDPGNKIEYNPKKDNPPKFSEAHEKLQSKLIKKDEEDIVENLMAGELEDEDFDEVYEFD